MNTGYEKPEIEKIRKAQWTPENTRKTQSIVDRLVQLKAALAILASTYNNSTAAYTLNLAIERFKELDKGVK